MDEAPDLNELKVPMQVGNGDDGILAENDVPAALPPQTAEQSNTSSFLNSLLPLDPNTRRRVVTALLRAVLAERTIT